MYGFENENLAPWDQWEDETEAAADEFRGVMEGWLIQRTAPPERCSGSKEELTRYLQIGTGQWCSAPYATLFPLYSTAVLYAGVFGFVVGENVRIVRHRF